MNPDFVNNAITKLKGERDEAFAALHQRAGAIMALEQLLAHMEHGETPVPFSNGNVIAEMAEDELIESVRDQGGD